MKAFSKSKAKKFHDIDLILLAIDYFEYITPYTMVFDDIKEISKHYSNVNWYYYIYVVVQ